jgi:hypothetical protein
MFSFGGSSSKSSSSSNSNTFIDPNQQPYLDDINQKAQSLNAQGMPVEGVAGINPTLQNSLDTQNQAGQMQTSAGTGLMNVGSAQMSGTTNALNYANNAMGENTSGQALQTGANFGNQMADNTNQIQGSQGSGVNHSMAGNMASNASQANTVQNQGFNQSNLNNYINNDVMSGQIDAMSRDVTRNLQENELTGNAAAAIGGGNMGSSRKQMLDFGSSQRAADRIADASSNIRSNAYNNAMNIEANRASQNANIASGNNQFNAGSQNTLMGQGYSIDSNQLQGNLNRDQQANISNQNAVNSANQFGTNLGANQYNVGTNNQYNAAQLGNNIGQSGVNNMVSGQNMMNTGTGQSMAAGQYQRDYDQQLLNQDYREDMDPYQSLEFYDQMVGDPTKLSEASSSSSGKSKSASFGFG